jgi:hypothetical protein
VGTYSYERGGQEVHCRVNVEDGRLIIDSWADVWRRTPLVPVGDADEGRFATESFPYDVTFVTGEDGSVQEMRVEGPDSVWGSLPRRLKREPAAPP